MNDLARDGSTMRCAVCSPCLTLLASPDSAGGGLGRARIVSRRRVLFLFFLPKSLFRSQASIRTSITMYYWCVCFLVCTLFSDAHGYFLALSAAGHANGPPVHHGASLGPGRAPWRVLWAFKVAKSGKKSRGCFAWS